MKIGEQYNIQTRLRPVEIADAAFICALRQNKELNRYLSATSASVADQENWLKAYEDRNRRGEESYFIIENTTGRKFGAIRLYQMDRNRKSFVIGSWIIAPEAPKNTALESIALAYDYAYNELHLELCYFEAMKENRKVLKFHDLYATRTHADDRMVFFSLSKEQFSGSLLAAMLTEKKLLQPQIIEVPCFGDSRGKLSVLEKGNILPFEIRRIFYTYAVPSQETRGEHAHKKCHQFLIAVHGSLEVLVDDGKNKAKYCLNAPTRGLLIPAGFWGVQYNHSPDSVLLVLASEHYEAADYIRNYDEYLEYIRSC